MDDQSNKFPIKESYQSADGNMIEFEIRLIDASDGYMLKQRKHLRVREKDSVTGSAHLLQTRYILHSKI